jgi:RNA polymerase sigma factor (sigma-70 family)
MLHVLRQQAVPQATLDDVAEFLTAGLLATRSDPGNENLYTFYPKAHDRLRRNLTEEDAWSTAQALSRHLMTHPWAPHGITAILQSTDAVNDLPVTLQPLAIATASTLRLLGIAPSPESSYVEPADDTPENAEFSEFYRRFYPSIKRRLIARGASSEAAADSAQEAMLGALAQWARINQPERWAMSMASQIWNRRHRARQARELPVAEFPDGLIYDDPIDSERDVQSILDSLPPRQRQVMALFLDGYTDAEIAGSLEMQLRTVRKQWTLAIRQLRDEDQRDNSAARMRAVQISGDSASVEGPRSGYHNETYVFPLPADSSLGSHHSRFLVHEPRPERVWLDRRCFANESSLLSALAGRISHIPDVFTMEGVAMCRFIEGHTLGSRHPVNSPVPRAYLEQVVDLFRQLAAIGPDTILVRRGCAPEDRPADGDSTGFLERLFHFTEERVINDHTDQYGALFHALGVPPDSMERLRAASHPLGARPFCLLHGDLHRDNFIVDADGRLWTVDWKRAMFGDPLYDLATHLHLMGYPEKQEREVIDRWSGAVEEVRPGYSAGWRTDLPLYLDYKRVHSVYTDTIRAAVSLANNPSLANCRAAALRIRPVLIRAGAALDLVDVPDVRKIAEALAALTN